MIIHPHIPKRKARKPNAKTRALQASWQEILKKYDIQPTVRKNARVATRPSNAIVLDPKRDTSHIPSVDTGKGVAAKKESPKYTGDAMIGIGQLHKSNSVPVFRKEDAEDQAKMRRG